ncbi:hypothetical protein JCM24511_02694 [Saitozyma sp. JCM 24511]|nr:hypothetical protein JCM24511_02694 [Saitozyma sp. JCM 24511]
MAPLNPTAKRLRVSQASSQRGADPQTIIISFPILVVTTAILYRRAYLGEEQRTIPREARLDPAHRGHEKVLGRGVNEIGGAPWEVHDARGNAAGISGTTGTKRA